MPKPIMKWAVLALVLVLAASGACVPSQNRGPAIWIDQPLDGSLVSPGPLTITAHASSPMGIKVVEFFSSNQAGYIGYVKADGSHLFEAQVEWTPPGPGKYNLSVRAVDNNGGIGDQAWSTIQVVEMLEILPTFTATEVVLPILSPWPTLTPTFTPAALAVSSTPTPAAISMTSTGTPSPAVVTFTSTPGPAGGAPTLLASMDANCRTGPSTLYEIDDGLHKGQVGMIEGRNADNSWVWIREPSGGGGHCWVSVVVGSLSGDLSTVLIIQAPPLPITTTPSKTPELVVQTPPQVSIQAGDTTLETEGNPCTNHPTSTPITATINSSARISKVVLHWSGGQSGAKSMPSTGGKHYKASLGSFSDPGTLAVWVSAVDENGMEGVSVTISVTVTSACVQ
jgi:hypothetical protein